MGVQLGTYIYGPPVYIWPEVHSKDIDRYRPTYVRNDRDNILRRVADLVPFLPDPGQRIRFCKIRIRIRATQNYRIRPDPALDPT